MPKITPDITYSANKIYKSLPSHIKKGEWVSDAIIEKHNREQGKLFTPEQETRIREIVKEVVK